MQQSSATPSLHLWFWGVAEDCCMLSILLAVPSCIYSFWHGVIPTSYFIFNDFYTCTQCSDRDSEKLKQHNTKKINQVRQQAAAGGPQTNQILVFGGNRLSYCGSEPHVAGPTTSVAGEVCLCLPGEWTPYTLLYLPTYPTFICST